MWVVLSLSSKTVYQQVKPFMPIVHVIAIWMRYMFLLGLIYLSCCLYLKAAVILHVLGNGLSLFPSEVLRKLVMNDWAAYYRPMMNDWPAHYSELWLVHFPSYLRLVMACVWFVWECSQSQCIPLAAEYPSAAQPQPLSDFRCLSGNPIYPKLPCQVPSYVLHAHRLLFYGICPQLPLNYQLSVPKWCE